MPKSKDAVQQMMTLICELLAANEISQAAANELILGLAGMLKLHAADLNQAAAAQRGKVR